MADEFDERFPGWRDPGVIRMTPQQQREQDEAVGWVPRAAPMFDDDPYAEIRPRDD